MPRDSLGKETWDQLELFRQRFMRCGRSDEDSRRLAIQCRENWRLTISGDLNIGGPADACHQVTSRRDEPKRVRESDQLPDLTIEPIPVDEG